MFTGAGSHSERAAEEIPEKESFSSSGTYCLLLLMKVSSWMKEFRMFTGAGSHVERAAEEMPEKESFSSSGPKCLPQTMFDIHLILRRGHVTKTCLLVIIVR